MWLIFAIFLDADWWLLLWNSSAIHTTNISKPNTKRHHKVGLYFSLWLNIFLLQVRNSIFLPPKILIISCQHLKGNNVFNIERQICQLNGEDDYKTDVIQFVLQWKSRSSVSSLISLPIMACRFMHDFIVDCRFASLIVDVDFRQ